MSGRLASLAVGITRRSAARAPNTLASVLVGQPKRLFSSTATRSALNISADLDTFERRHISANAEHTQQMLSTLGFNDIEELISQTVPQNIRLNRELDLGFEPEGESKALQTLKDIMSQNKVVKSYIGLGYYNCITPPVILRNILENPLWYTPYTPYQAEISQGRLESLLNFQTLVSDLTGLPNANASLLDEATAGAEAMTYCLRSSSSSSKAFFVSHEILPQTIDLIKTRAEPIGVEVIVGDFRTFDFASKPVFGAVLQYPNSNGEILDYSSFISAAHSSGALVCVETDLLALTILKSPGELGADVAFGSAQRFGVPLGYGGPHAAFFAIANQKDSRKVPGRIIGVSKTVDGKAGYRLALQTREQHIRREKATSNICTAQALLANIAAMYAVYHGPEGLKKIAARIHHLTIVLQQGLGRLGHTINPNALFFDTITVRPQRLTADQIVHYARVHDVNLRKVDDETIAISLDETTTEKDIEQLFDIFNNNQSRDFTASSLAASASCLILSSPFYRSAPILTHPIFNSYHTEHELLRYIYRLSSKDLSLATSMIALGSCTMKLNATSEMIPVTWPEVGAIHPFAPLEQTLGYQQMFNELDIILSEITGFSKISFQPNAGSQGEYAGLMTIRKYLQSIGQGHRNICLIPSSAHGTNPASANMAGMKIEVVECGPDGYISIESLRAKATANADHIAAVMVTYPSTFGIFEETIKEVCQIVHGVGGQVYLDGANMNAMVGLCRPGDVGADVCHLNLHKTFCIPHGGGGPGMGPIGVAKHLVPFLPQHSFLQASQSVSSSSKLAPEFQLGAVSASPWASSSILPITWMYTRMMGAKGVANASKMAILNANYMRKRLEPYYHIRFTSKNGFCAHEFIVDFNPFKKTSGVEVSDVAKRLMDYNFHSPTMSWPVPGTLMIEPTESETKAELDRFCDALIQIRHEIEEIEKGVYPQDNNVLKNSPHTAESITGEWNRPYPRDKAVFPLPWVRSSKFWPAVSRIDNAFGDTHLVCSCPPIESYSQ